MKSFLRVSLGFGLTAALVSGCVGQIEPAPEDEAALEGDNAGDESEMAPEAEPVGETSQEISSCAVSLVCSGTHQLTVYEHSDCSGGKMALCPGDYADLRDYNQGLGWFANWNDRISILSTAKVYAYVYSDTNFKGDVKYIGPNQWKNIGGTIWNDQISSIKVRATF